MAERLTDHELDNYNDPGCQNCSDYCWRSCKEDDAVKDCAQRLIYNRLAAYEDTGLTPEEVAHAKDLFSAERDGQLYTVHDVAVILASAIGDDCACNINSNDEWLPQLCELQEACPHPVGVACWEQYLKHRAEAEKTIGKEAQA